MKYSLQFFFLLTISKQKYFLVSITIENSVSWINNERWEKEVESANPTSDHLEMIAAIKTSLVLEDSCFTYYGDEK